MVLIYALLILPLLLVVKFNFNLTEKVGTFKFGLFGILIFKGKVQLTKQGVVVSFIKSRIIPYSSFLSMGKKIKPLKDYNVLSIKFIADFGSENLAKSFSIAGFLNILLNQVRAVIKKTIPRLKIKNEFKIHEVGKNNRIQLKLSAVFNIITLILSIIKILMEKLIYGIKNRQQDKGSNRGRSKGVERAY